MVAEISRTNNLLIMEKCKDDLEREFFLLGVHADRKFNHSNNHAHAQTGGI